MWWTSSLMRRGLRGLADGGAEAEQLGLALVAQVGGWLAAAAWCITQLLFVAGVVEIDYFAPATGAYAVESVALIVIGLWIAGANLLAGPWLGALRWFGAVTGVGLVLHGIGALISGGECSCTRARSPGWCSCREAGGHARPTVTCVLEPPATSRMGNGEERHQRRG